MVKTLLGHLKFSITGKNSDLLGSALSAGLLDCFVFDFEHFSAHGARENFLFWVYILYV